MGKIIQKITPYEKLMHIYKENILLRNISSNIHWDYEVVMPEKGLNQRAEEMSFLSGLIHERMIDPKKGILLEEIQSHPDYEMLSEVEKRNVILIQREYDKNTKIPIKLAKELSKHSVIATKKWKEAKEKANYSIFKKDLEKMFELKKQVAACLNPDKDPYDVFLDVFEHGFNKQIYDKIFDLVKNGLIPIITACIDSSDQPDESLILRKCPIDLQQKVANDLCKIVQYDLKGGRIDVAAHPFTTGYYDDVRITVDYNENDFTSSFYATMHEAGHALYAQNYFEKYKYQPVGDSASSAMDEGQALFIENNIGRCPEFWQFYFPRFKKITGNTFTDVELAPFIQAINKVAPSKIRIHADPITYSMHIILRYELEKQLFSGKLTVDELPDFWNEKMKSYLNIDINNDAEGILQDTHYAWGLFGYFPTYALGSVYNEQFLFKMSSDIPDWKEQMKKGQFTSMLNWLNVNIRNQGSMYEPLDLIKKVTGKEFTSKYFIENTREKCSKIYDL